MSRAKARDKLRHAMHCPSPVRGRGCFLILALMNAIEGAEGYFPLPPCKSTWNLITRLRNQPGEAQHESDQRNKSGGNIGFAFLGSARERVFILYSSLANFFAQGADYFSSDSSSLALHAGPAPAFLLGACAPCRAGRTRDKGKGAGSLAGTRASGEGEARAR